MGNGSAEFRFNSLVALVGARMLWRPKMMICLSTVPSSAALVVWASTGPCVAMASNRTARTALRKHPATALRHRVDGLGSIFGVIGFMAIAFICVGPTFYSKSFKADAG